MNLLPAVEAYILERQAQLNKAAQPNFQAVRELESVAILCRGLRRQSDAMDQMLEPYLQPKPPAAPQVEVWPCPQCLGNRLHEDYCPLHPRNLTKL